MREDSYFDGKLSQLFWWKLVSFLVNLVTFGIAAPWTICLVYNWEISHTVINGKRLSFDGTGLGLAGLWFKWILLCIITLGIYIFWLDISLKKWKTKHTYIENI